MEEFWNNLNDCVVEAQDDTRVVLLGDMNAKAGNEQRRRCVSK